MLANRISLMNEFAHLADRLDADIEAVRRGIGSDPRIGFDFIYPGTGYGGSCFPKDVKALIQTGKQVGYETEITKAVESVNNKQNVCFSIRSKNTLIKIFRVKHSHCGVWPLNLIPTI